MAILSVLFEKTTILIEMSLIRGRDIIAVQIIPFDIFPI